MNLRKTSLSVIILLLFAVFANAQFSTPDARAKKSDEILKKIRQIDLLNQILPVVMTKDQMKKILPAVEKARVEVRKAEQEEFEFLLKLDKDLDISLKEGIEKGKVPEREALVNIAAALRTLGLKRAAVVQENTDTVQAELEKVLNEGQIKAARNALLPSNFDPTIDPKKITDDQKFKFWVRTILLDPLSYDLLVKLSK